MIWFTCKGCGKKLKRPDEAGGSLVFCECGQSNRVPWESALPDSEIPAEPEKPRHPEREPEERRRWGDREGGGWGWREDMPRRRGWGETERRDPDYCFNHQERPSEQTCEDCGERFCPACMVTVKGKTLCGPCKNFRIRSVLRPPRFSTLAIVSLVVGLVSGPPAFCLGFLSIIPDSAPAAGVVMDIAGMLLPALAVVLGIMALREVESSPRVAGRGLALTGTATGIVGLVWCVAIAIVVVGRHVGE